MISRRDVLMLSAIRLSSSTGLVCDTLPGVAAQAEIMTDASSAHMSLMAYFMTSDLQISYWLNSTFGDRTQRLHPWQRAQTHLPATSLL